MAPKTKNNKKTLTKRKYNKKKGVVGRIPRTVNMGPIPDSMWIKLKYSDRFTVSGNPAGVHVFRLNSLHQPDLTKAGSHQPLYYDQIVNTLEGNGLFHKYMATEFSYHLEAQNQGSEAVQVIVCPTTHNNAFSVSDDIDALCEAPYAQCRVLTQANESLVKMGGVIDIKKLEGVNTLDHSNYQATYGQNPAFTPLLNIYCARLDESANAIDVDFSITCYFKCKVFDRIFRSSTN